MENNYTAEQLRSFAKEVIEKSNCLYDIREKIYKEALSGKFYLKIGFKVKYLKEFVKYCSENGLLFKNYGNDGSGSESTTIYIDWSVKGDGLND